MNSQTNIINKEATQIRLYLNQATNDLNKEFKATKKKLREFKKEISKTTEEEYEKTTGQSFYAVVLEQANHINFIIEGIVKHLEENFEIESSHCRENLIAPENNYSEFTIRTARNRLLENACSKLSKLTSEINYYLARQAEDIGNTEHRNITRVIEFQLVYGYQDVDCYSNTRIAGFSY